MNNSNKKILLKQKLTNSIMKHGNKKTVEKILTKSLKSIQKSNKKNHINLIKKSIINLTSAFKIGQQAKKRGKKKLKNKIPIFIKKDSLRTISAINILVEFSKKKSSKFYKKLTNEILELEFSNGKSVEKRIEIQKQVLMQKRYLLNFRW